MAAPRLRTLRHELTGRLRNGATHYITGLPEDRRATLARRARSTKASRAVMHAAASWYGRAPVPIAGGLGHLLYVSTADLPLDGAHAGLIVRGTLACAGGLAGKTIAIEGLEATVTDVLVRVHYADGRLESHLLRPATPSAWSAPFAAGNC